MEKLLRRRDAHKKRLSKIEKNTADLLMKTLDEVDESKFVPDLEKILNSHSTTISDLVEKNKSLEKHFKHEECPKCEEGKSLKFNKMNLGCECKDE